jgi:hypothetical protein
MGERAERSNKEAEVVLRVNTIKTTRKFLKDKFAEQEIKAIEVPHNPDALVLEERKIFSFLTSLKKVSSRYRMLHRNMSPFFQVSSPECVLLTHVPGQVANHFIWQL